MPQLKYLVTFIPNKREPIHNWYYYKEGFSRRLVDIFLKQFQLDKNSIVLDPFCGCGTTNLACKQAEIRSIGFDVSSLCVFISKVKTRDYNVSSLEWAVTNALKWKFERPKELPQEKWIRNAFSTYALEDVIFYKNKILEIEDQKIRDFLLLALMDSAMKSSWIEKDGALVRLIKKQTVPVGKFFKYKIRKMLKDLKNANLKPVRTEIEIGDARDLKLEDESVDAVITSPPYLNKIEYTKIYNIELYLFFDLPETKLRSFIGSNVDTDEMVDAYFKDIFLSLKELQRVCKENAKLAIVIGGGCFPDRVVEVDTKTAELAEEIGFKVKKILVARNLWCTRARTIKVGKIRESIILLKKI